MDLTSRSRLPQLTWVSHAGADVAPRATDAQPVRPEPTLAPAPAAEEEGAAGRAAAAPEVTVDGEDETDDETDNAEARTPKTTRNPYAPTERERREHNVAHLPYRNWCRLFLEGRGLDLPHQHRPDEEVKQASVSIDYTDSRVSRALREQFLR